MILNDKEYITMPELQRLHNVSRWSVYAWIEAKLLPCEKVLGRYLFEKGTAVAFRPPWRDSMKSKPGRKNP
jgi:hypothetical protein